MVIGDIVIHNTFPPIQGVVATIQPSEYIEAKIGVLRFDTKTLFYDSESTWDVQGNIKDYQERDVECEIIQSDSPEVFISGDNENIIDADFREIE